MSPSLVALVAAIRCSLRTRAELEAEIFALRHQLAVLQQAAPKRLRLSRTDRLVWVLISRVWREWQGAVRIVKPATVVYRRLFAWHWRWRSRVARLGRPPITGDVRTLIRQMHHANPLWGAGLSTSTWRYQRQEDPTNVTLLALLQVHAAKRPRWGDRRLHTPVHGDGLRVNHKRVHRVYRAAALQVPRRRRKRRPRGERGPLPVPNGRRQRWSMDFVTDTLA